MGRALLGALLLLLPWQGTAADHPLHAGLVGYLTLDEHLRIIAPSGEEMAGEFSRHSQAFADDLLPVDENVPRYQPGRFGRGIQLEPGCESGEKYECRNWLAPEAAQILPVAGQEGPYRSVGEAQAVFLVRGKNEPAGTGNRVMEGTHALQAQCRAADAGVESSIGVPVLEGNYALSLFARSAGEQAEEETIGLELVDAAGVVLGTTDVPIGRAWRRVELGAAVGKFTREVKQQKYREVRLRVLGRRAGQAFAIDAVMLEHCGGYSYAGMSGASSWLPGRNYRSPESLDVSALRYVLGDRTGSVAFWGQLRGRSQSWRTLFEIAGGNRWQPFLQLSLRSNTRLSLGGQQQKPTNVGAAVELKPGTWHHYAVTWNATSAVLYLDGKKTAEIDGLDIPRRLPSLRLGSAGPNAPANAVIDEAVIYNRPLTGVEVAALASRETPLSDVLSPAVTVGPVFFLETIAHGLAPQTWLGEVRNAGPDSRRGLEVTFQLGEFVTLKQKLGRLKAGATAPVTFAFLPDLALGKYPLCVTVGKGGRDLARFARQIEITPAPAPFENLQVSPWGFNSERDYGLTFGGGDIEEAMRKGLSWAPLYSYLGYPRAVDGDDWVHDMNGKPFRASLTSPYIKAQIDREGARIAQRYAAIPAMRGVTLNSEMQWLWSQDYSPHNVAWVQKHFGIDLNRWRNPPKGVVDYHQTPYGRLIPRIGGFQLPPDRIISPQEPLYAYHRWFHGPDGPTESYLNQTLSEAIHARRPDVLTILEPILRRPAVRAFTRMSIGQEWFYYENPTTAVMIQENLNAAVRGTPLRPTGMPQFLFKAGGAAPYNSVATADLFHETAWLCALQPIRMFTYWNFNVVPTAGYEDPYSKCMTKAEIDQLFGTPTPTWDEAKKALANNPETGKKLMPWTPELIATFKRFHQEEVGPLAGLLPQWQNRPRRMAVLRSFASQLYSEVRWPNTTWLENSAVYCGVPFDILYDQDFEDRQEPLASYQLVIVSATVCLPQPVYEALRRFAARGGVVAVDSDTKVSIPGAVLIEPKGSLTKFQADMEAQAALLRERHGVSSPAYIEAMSRQAEAGELANLVEPEFLRLLTERIRPEARSLTPNTWLNLLEAEGACYIGVVNDLRVPGPIYGHFGKIRETGIPQTAKVVFAPTLGQVAYDLLAQRLLGITEKTGDRVLPLELPAGGARLVMLLPRPVDRLNVSAESGKTVWGDHRGRDIRVNARLQDAGGKPIPGLVPATVSIFAPDGSRSDFSRHTVFCRGVLDYRFPVLRNGPTGAWRIAVLERASGKTAEAKVQVGP